jgi:hypothetical protein
MKNHLDTSAKSGTWFYLDGPESKGPLDASSILRVLLARPNPNKVLVWREGFGEWRKAGETELGPLLPASSAQHAESIRSNKNVTPRRLPLWVKFIMAIPVCMLIVAAVQGRIDRMRMTPEQLAAFDAEQAKERFEASKKEENCKADLKCLGEKSLSYASGDCRQFIEHLAKNDFQWTDEWYQPKFSHYRWGDRDRGIITYIGDRIKLQNGFGAWIRSTYECDYDTQAKKVIDARAWAGQIPPS